MKFWLKVVCVVFVLCAATLVALYLAGVIFLMLSKMNYKDATLSTFYQYWYYYHSDIAFQKRINLSGIFGAVLAYGMPLGLYIAAIQKKRELYGAARFANSGEIRDSGLLGSDGILVGKYNNRYMMLGGQQSVMLAAPQRSGKGVGRDT
jgi:type IV secretion system protein VirD4